MIAANTNHDQNAQSSNPDHIDDTASPVRIPNVDLPVSLPAVQGAGLILVADDEAIARELCRFHLEAAGFEVITANDGCETLELVNPDVDAVLLDLRMPRMGGQECLERMRRINPQLRVIVVSGVTQVDEAIAAIRNGADEFIQKPFDPVELINRVSQAAHAAQLHRENQRLKSIVNYGSADSGFVATCQQSRQLLEKIRRLAELESTVLITGESGTGKTQIARMIHQSSNRRSKPFVALNCAALPRELLESELFGHCRGAFTGAVSDRQGKVEVADGGTLFLDEIGDLPVELQPKLLTFLQERCFQRIGSNRTQAVDVRVIAATHQDLSALTETKAFREDLLYRLNVLNLKVPSLVNRLEDLPLLCVHILTGIAEQHHKPPKTLEHAALMRLKSHSWAGNIRELQNVLERAAAFCATDVIRVEDLDLFDDTCPVTTESRPFALAGRTLAEIEKDAIEETLLSTGGNRALAARMLGVSEKTIYNKLRKIRNNT